MRTHLAGIFLVICSALTGEACRADEQQASPKNSQSSLSARVAQLIERLGDASYHRRVSARWELERIGLPAFGQLRAAVDHPNIQIASAARYLVQSQNVVWWLETDSVDVRRLLMDYNGLSLVERDTRLQSLSVLGTDDALLALCRLTRFESNEQLSRSAALYLMEAMVEADKHSQSLPRSILLALEDAQRPAADWIRALAKHLDGQEVQAAQWKEFVAQEAQSALAGGQQGKLRADPADRARALRFYKWVGNWLVQITDREQALEVASDSLELVADDDHACLEFAHWAMDAKMPELVIALAKKNPHHFESKASLGYVLAESYLDTGDEQTAQAFAVAASDQIEREAEKARRIPSANIKDAIASRRIDMAIVDLSSRGMFDWAEAELKRAVELETSPNINADARSELANFYWAADRNREAAEVLEPLLDLPADHGAG